MSEGEVSEGYEVVDLSSHRIMNRFRLPCSGSDYRLGAQPQLEHGKSSVIPASSYGQKLSNWNLAQVRLRLSV